MKKYVMSVKCIFCVAAVMAATSPLFVSCESSDAVDPLKVAHDDSSKESSNISGVWTGISGSGSYSTTVSISEKNGSVSGSLKWSWGGKRKFSGSRVGNSVVWTNQADQDGVRDTWNMTLSSNGRKLTGRATKSDGGSYSISLSR